MTDKKKFFFDLHNFNDDAEEEEGPPPPPTFSEEELAQAKDAAYRKGKEDGFKESQESLEKKISVLLETTQRSFLDLQAAEADREKRYEEEAVHLALELFKTIYPAWIKKCGPEEVENAIAKVLESVANQQSVHIEVCPALLTAVEERFKPVEDALNNLSLVFHGNDTLTPDDMRMKWENGGAVRDSRKLAAQILQSLTSELPVTPEEEKEDLAENGEKRHNEDIKTHNPDE